MCRSSGKPLYNEGLSWAYDGLWSFEIRQESRIASFDRAFRGTEMAFGTRREGRAGKDALALLGAASWLQCYL